MRKLTIFSNTQKSIGFLVPRKTEFFQGFESQGDLNK